MYLGGLFCKKEETGHLLFKSNLEFTIQTFTNTPGEKKPSAIQIPSQARVHTHTQSRKTTSLTVHSCSPINKEMEHIETKSNATVIRPTDLASIMMGRESLHLGQTPSSTRTTFALVQKQTKDAKALCFPHSLTYALSYTHALVLRPTGLGFRHQMKACCADGPTHIHSQDSNTQKPLCLFECKFRV